MPRYRVLKKINIDGRLHLAGVYVDLDERRGNWLAMQHQAVALVGPQTELPALTQPKPKQRRCCGR
jgi:hypothetical protein